MPNQHLAFTSTGSPSAQTLVFLHGGGGGAWSWQPVIQELPGYRCLAVDLPEHGNSRHIAPFSMALAAEKVAELVQAEAGGKAHVIGLSEGAQVLVQLLASRPQVVDKAILSSALLHPLPGSSWMSSPAVLAWSFRLSIPPFRKVDWWIRLNMKYAAGIPAAFYPQFKQDFQQMTESQFVNLMAANQRFRLPPGLDKAGAAALVIVGKKEYPAMKQSARDLAAALPNARALQLDLGARASLAEEHNWALTAPGLFASTVRAWLEGTLLPEVLQPL